MEELMGTPLHRCENCRMWQKVPARSEEENMQPAMVGECHARAPGVDGFPLTSCDDWCGEWQPSYRYVTDLQR